MSITRRELIKLSAVTLAAGAVCAPPLKAMEQTETELFTEKKGTRVAVCGGGFGGLTVAKYLRQFNPGLDVIVIEQKEHFMACPYSNVWLGDMVTLDDLTYDYAHAANRHGYRFFQAVVTAIDRKRRVVTTEKGAIGYDYLVLAPGIAYDYSRIAKNDEEARNIRQNCPPALMPFGDHIALKREMKNFKGGNFVISVPSGSYRCPPAPYERACMVAYYFKQHNIKGRVVILDPRPKPAAKPEGFLHTFETLYPGVIEYIPDITIKSVDTEKKELLAERFDKTTLAMKQQTIPYSVANIIPENKAAPLIDLADIKQVRGGWAVMDEPTFQSISDDRVYVVGDATNYPYPKSAHMANSCGYLAAKELAFRTLGKSYDVFSETPGNVCFSLVNGSPKEGIVVHHTVSYPKGKIKVDVKATHQRDRETGEAVRPWFDGIMGDILG